MNDAEVIAAARVEIEKVRNWRDPRKGKADHVEYVLLPLEVAERMLLLAVAHLAGGGDPEP